MSSTRGYLGCLGWLVAVTIFPVAVWLVTTHRFVWILVLVPAAWFALYCFERAES